MKNIFAIFAGLIITGASAYADDTGVGLPQVSSTPSRTANDEREEPAVHATNPAETGDYQRQVLSNPMISDIGRAEALTGGGGNTAIIMQKGGSNRSSVTQSGNDNYVSHTQNGNNNDIRVDQKGEHNRSDEDQTGDNNHKTIIQNGKDRDENSDSGDWKDDRNDKEQN